MALSLCGLRKKYTKLDISLLRRKQNGKIRSDVAEASFEFDSK
jgi:hypothetical protein